MSLPSGYKRLEYIESSGTQYIDTTVVVSAATISGLRVQFLSEKTNVYGSSFWNVSGCSGSGVVFYIGCATGGQLYYGNGTTDVSAGANYSGRTVFDLNPAEKKVSVEGALSLSSVTFNSPTGSSNFFLSAYNKGNGYDCHAEKIYWCKIHSNGSLIRDFIPCLTDAGVAGLWDDVNGKFYSNAGTGTFVAGPVAIYTELEYIESDGTQYINLNYIPNSNTRVVMECENLSHIQAPFFGARTTAKSYSFFLWDIGETQFRSDYSSETNSQVTGTISSIVGKLTIDKNKNVCTVNGVTTTNTQHTFVCSYPMFVFTGNTAGEPYTNKLSMRVSTIKVYDNGAAVRDCVPVMRQDGAVGLLDTVNNVFYPDAAGGNFIAGPVAVQPGAPETLEVIGTTQNAVVLAWPAVPVNQSYRLYRDGIVVYEGNDLHYTDSGLAAGSAHTYSIHGVGGTVETEGVTAEATTTEGIVLITDRTLADVSAGRAKGRYNALDLIRVGEAMVYAQGLLQNSGYGVSVSVKLDWKLDDIPTQGQMTTYLANLRTLRSAMDLLASTPAVPDSMARLNHERANDIEQILVDVEYTVYHVFYGLFRSNQFDAWAGDHRPFPTANSDMGRTWEELDDMGTTWANWELATWYLLLYGNLKTEGVVS